MQLQKTFLLSGGTGFLGGHLQRYLLKQGHRVISLVRRNVGADSATNPSLTLLSTSDNWHQQIEGQRLDAIYHTAASGMVAKEALDVDAIVDANISLGLKLLETARAQSGKRPAFIHCASFWQFSNGTLDYAPNSLYGASKQAFCDLVEHYRRNEGIPALGLVLFDTYGPGDRRQKLIWALVAHCARLRAGVPTEPFPMTGGEQQVAFTHIDDVVQGFERARELLEIDGGDHPLYFLRGTELQYLRQQIAEALSHADVPQSAINWRARAYRGGEIMTLVKGPTLPGWQPEKSFKEEFARLVIDYVL